MSRRVAVTGLGLVSPVGCDVQSSWSSVCDGKTGVGPLTLFDSELLPVKIAAEVKGFDPEKYFAAKELKRVTRFIQFATAASFEALQSAGLDPEEIGAKTGVSIGVGMGDIDLIAANTKVFLESGYKRVSPFFIPFTIANMAAGYVAQKYGLKGPNICPTTACTSGTHGVGEGFRSIRDGSAEVMVAGGAEGVICPMGMVGFVALKALCSSQNDSPALASRPFDANRSGFVMGEGSGILVLEEWERAKKRGAKIYAEVVGYGQSGDAFHITAPAPEGEGAARCMQAAMSSAGLQAEDIQYINAHGTSTKLNDKNETMAIKTVFGSHANKLAVSSTKGATGHCLGAAGGIEAVFSVKALEEQKAPPTLNYENKDEDCDLDYVGEGKARPMTINHVLSNSFGFGGTNGSLIFKRVEA
jgi:3-oxoacyl-[acyl-carrier-protein] synthase II